MKKFKILLVTLLAVVLVTSCKDETDTYVRHLYSNSTKATAFKTCLSTSLDSAVNHLCVANGFYQSQNGRYRIDYSALPASVFDTLARYNYAYLSDSLVTMTNKLAESCGDPIDDAFSDAIKKLEFVDYDALLYGDSTAITDYFKLYKYSALYASLQSPVSIRMNLYGVNDLWAHVLNIYHQHNSTPVNFDLQGYIVDKIIDDVLYEMAIEEINIRTYASHRSENDSILGL